MKKPDRDDVTTTQARRLSRRARLEALLFAGAALGTTVLSLGAMAEPKSPPFKSE